MNEQSLIEKSASRVSIVIPVYNREKYITLAVESVLRQTFQDWELIISDDGSIDGTLDIARQFALEDDRIRVLTAEHRGAVYALIAGFDAARGEFIGQLDSDDLLEPEAIELTVEALDDDIECGMVYTNYIDIDKNGQKLQPGRRCAIPYSRERILINFMTFHFRLIRRSIYILSGKFNPRFNLIEDYELCLRLSEITQIKKVEKFLYQYRTHSESQTRTKGLKMIYLCKKAMQEALERQNLDKVYKARIEFNPTYWLEEIKLTSN